VYAARVVFKTTNKPHNQNHNERGVPTMCDPNEKCEQRIEDALESRLSDLRILWEGYQNGEESNEEVGCGLHEYGLGFDYVPPFTFGETQKAGYWRYQISYGGPSEEIRFFCDGLRVPKIIEFWLLDWFDGAVRELQGNDFRMMSEWFAMMDDCGAVALAYDQEMTQ
jgi:hypothetical protein